METWITKCGTLYLTAEVTRWGEKIWETGDGSRRFAQTTAGLVELIVPGYIPTAQDRAEDLMAEES